MAREKRIQLTRDLAYKLVETAPKTYWSEFSQSLYLARASIDKPTGLTRGNHVATQLTLCVATILFSPTRLGAKFRDVT